MKITIELPDSVEELKKYPSAHLLQAFMLPKEKFAKILFKRGVLIKNEGALIDVKNNRALIRLDIVYNPPTPEEVHKENLEAEAKRKEELEKLKAGNYE